MDAGGNGEYGAEAIQEGRLEGLARARALRVQAALQRNPRVEVERVRLREIEALGDVGGGSGATEISLSVR